MSIVLWAERCEPWAPQTDSCYYCGDLVGEVPSVMWAGPCDILLHAKCAERWGTHLIADSREAAMATGEAPHWTRRAARALRSALVAQEARAE
jgi:hypothetical protein